MPSGDGPIGGPPEIEGVEIPIRESDSSEPFIWAQRFGAFTPGRDAESTALCRVALQTKGLGDPADEVYDLANAIEPWFDALRTWVEAMTGQDLDPNHKVFAATVVGAGLTVIVPASMSEGATGLTITTPRIIPVASREWHRILARVAAGEEPPLEEQLSRDSRAAFARGQLRRAVIDAASAAEIVLHRVLRSEATREDMPTPALRRKYDDLDKQPLGGLVTLARQCHLDPDVNLDDLDDLSQARNDAIHRALTPGSLRAFTVVQAAINMLGTHGTWKRTGVRPDDGSEWVVIASEPDA